ncbi:Shedu immune nuclease family protein [Terrimonas rubra]|uniref:Shedu immune nuclease family protein n=1 Tax=Terrimonas rubra TaxID=1035890 RepID=A0ABW6A3G5_9BACT
MKHIQPSTENQFSEDQGKEVFYFYGEDRNPVHKAKEIYKKEKIIIVYPYSLNRSTGQVTPKKIKKIEFRGWSTLEAVPNDFKKTLGYGFRTKRIKSFLQLIYSRFREVENIIFGINIQNRFAKKTITLNWGDVEKILKNIYKEFLIVDSNRKLLITNELSRLTTKIAPIEKKLTAGELEQYLSKFGSFEKITPRDVETLAKVFEKLPSGKIITTSHFIKTKEKLDIVYLEDVIEKFKKLLTVTNDNEEQWQIFFEKYSWVLTHLFPYQVILKKGKAYVGGKTIENAEGRVVDFLFASNLSDNFALLEIKTHNKELLKPTAYRKPDVFAWADELSGGLNQCLDQKHTFLKDFGKENPSYDPKAILVIGLKSKLNSNQTKCFELLRANQKNVDIVTFDELLKKLEGLHKVVTGKV